MLLLEGPTDVCWPCVQPPGWRTRLLLGSLDPARERVPGRVLDLRGNLHSGEDAGDQAEHPGVVHNLRRSGRADQEGGHEGGQE